MRLRPLKFLLRHLLILPFNIAQRMHFEKK